LVGGVIGGLGGHFRKGIARGDAKELGDLIEAGQATLLVIGESRLEEQLEKALTRAEKAVEKEIDVDRDEFKRELAKAEEAAGSGGAA
jgi:RNA-binding protein YlmH